MTEQTEGAKLLLVEDESAHAFLIKTALSQSGYLLERVETIAEALEYLKTSSVALILSDLNLDDAKGVETVKMLKQGVDDAVPIVVLTASTSLHDAVDAMRAGADDFVIKEFDDNFSQVLEFAVDRALRKAWAEAEQRRLKQEREYLQRAIEYGHDGLAVMKGFKCTYHNSAFRVFANRCGFNLENFGEFDLKRIKNPSRIKKRLMESFAREHDQAVVTCEIIPTDGTDDEAYELTLSAPPGVEAGGNKVKIFWIRDISEQKERERFQREMLSAASHDLKGPLSAISLSTELLAQIKEERKMEEIRIRIASLAKSCQNLVEELLSADSLRSGAMVVQPEPVPYITLMLQVLDEFKPVANSRSIKLSMRQSDIEQHKGKSWALDSLAFVRVLSNLVSNAIKYTPKQGTVELGVEEEEQLQVFVKDTGKGIEPSRVAKIFERYGRLDRDLKESGHGLGLYVTKGLVSAHGGSISVDSVVGKGSRFSVFFPKK